MTSVADVPRYDDELYSLASPGLTVEKLVLIIARANQLLPDSDPRKITPEKIKALRQSASEVEGEGWDASLTREFADALESYLPPEQ